MKKPVSPRILVLLIVAAAAPLSARNADSGTVEGSKDQGTPYVIDANSFQSGLARFAATFRETEKPVATGSRPETAKAEGEKLRIERKPVSGTVTARGSN